MGYPQPKVGKSQEISGMGRFLVKGNKPYGGWIPQLPPPQGPYRVSVDTRNFPTPGGANISSNGLLPRNINVDTRYNVHREGNFIMKHLIDINQKLSCNKTT